MSLSKQIKQLEEGLLDTSLSRQEYIRVQSVLLRKKRKSFIEIHETTGAGESSIKRWYADFSKHGIEGLYTKKRVVPPNIKLTEQQKETIKTILTQQKPSDYKYDDDFWSVPILKQLVKDQFGVVYKSEQSYRNLFEYCGFSFQKAEYVDANQNPDESSHFKKRFEKRLKKGTFSISW